MVTITKTIDVEIGIEDFTDSELLSEVEYRGFELVENYKSYDLGLVPTSDNILEYIISILPETKIGSEEFMIQDSIRRLRRI